MRFLSFASQGREAFGIELDAERVIDLRRAASAFPETSPPHAESLDDMLRDWDAGLRWVAAVRDRVSREGAREPVVRSRGEIVLRSPLRNPSKIVAVGLNYMDHCREQKVDPPPSPLLFAKFPSSIGDPDGVIRWDADLTTKVDFEVELGVVIGRRARGVPSRRALDYVAGYTVVHDVSARDLQFSDGQWVRGKSLDSFCPMGPVLVTRDEIPDPQHLRLGTRINGTSYQDSTTGEMIFPVDALIAFISRGITLEPGDVIATGTPDGVGVFRKPAVYLKDGDEVVVWVERIGELRSRCVAERSGS